MEGGGEGEGGVKKATMNPKNKDDKYDQYVGTVALNYREIKWNAERFLNVEPFINKYKCDGIKYPSRIEDWEKFESNNPTIALHVLHEKKKKNGNARNFYFKI